MSSMDNSLRTRTCFWLLCSVAMLAWGACSGDSNREQSDASTAGIAATGGDAAGTLQAGGMEAGATAGSGGANAGVMASGGTMTTGGTSSSASDAGSDVGGDQSCMAASLLTALQRDHLLVGASMSDASAQAAPFGARYLYISGGLFDGATPCDSCATGCTAGGASCDNTVGCAWWGCWQYDQLPPGAYLRDFVTKAEGDSQIPMVTYYEVLQASGAGEGSDEVLATQDATFMGRYLADFAFVLDQIGSHPALIHIEPDFWGYAEQLNEDPHAISAAVASASSECSGFEDSIAGLGRCMIAMVRVHAKNARVGLHGSGWATKMDVLQNRDSSLDVLAEARKLADFLVECGAADSDFIVVDPSDRDAAWYDTQGQDRWWDATNSSLPNFQQAFTWARALAERAGKPIVWWQVPVGNESLDNTSQRWRDNRVDYFMSHMDEVAAAHGAAMMFGAGDGQQTTPETDDGHLIQLVKDYDAAGGQRPCL